MVHATPDRGTVRGAELADSEWVLTGEALRFLEDLHTAVKHQREVGGNYFDLVLSTLSQGEASTGAMAGSTESEQFG